MKIKTFECGYCKQLECFVFCGGKFKSVKFPARIFLLSLPEGYLLFDSGYPMDFSNTKTTWGGWVYNKFLPVTMTKEDSCVTQLEAAGITPEEIKYIFISHFHIDHIGGLRDFPDAKFICSGKEYAKFLDTKGWKAVFKAYFHHLLPDDFESRMMPIEKELSLADVEPIHLPGHTLNQYGLLLKNEKILLAADSVWSEKAFTEGRLPPYISMFLMEDKKAYTKTVNMLTGMYKKGVKIISSHGEER